LNSAGKATPSITLFNASSTTNLTIKDAATGTKTGSTGNFSVTAAAAHALTFKNCAEPQGGSSSCSNVGGTTSTVSVPKKNGGTAAGTWTANVGLIDLYGNQASATSEVDPTISFTTASGATNTATFSFAGGTSPVIASGNSLSNTFTFQPTTNGAMSPYGTVTASATGLTSVTATVTTT
jgi:hypothetical protein